MPKGLIDSYEKLIAEINHGNVEVSLTLTIFIKYFGLYKCNLFG